MQHNLLIQGWSELRSNREPEECTNKISQNNTGVDNLSNSIWSHKINWALFSENYYFLFKPFPFNEFLSIWFAKYTKLSCGCPLSGNILSQLLTSEIPEWGLSWGQRLLSNPMIKLQIFTY